MKKQYASIKSCIMLFAGATLLSSLLLPTLLIFAENNSTATSNSTAVGNSTAANNSTTASSPKSQKTPAKYTDYSKSGTKIGAFSTLSQAEKALDEYPGGVVKDSSGSIVYQEPDFTSVDLRFPAPGNINAASIDRFLSQHASPLAGLGASFIYAQHVYGVNASYLVAHAIEESDWGRSPLAVSKDNLYGTGAFDANANLAGSFPSLDYAIRYQAWVIRKNYLNPGYSHTTSPTLDGMSANYASDPHWADKIRAVMNQLALFMGDTVKSYRQYRKGTPAPTPVVNAEPTYVLSGATTITLRDKYYGQIPVYDSVGDGQLQMFSRDLKLGDNGDDVSTLQAALNDEVNAGLTVDGNFGVTTQAALEQFQTQQGVPATGVCDFDLWSTGLNLPAPKTLSVGRHYAVDQMAQGMMGADVVQWYHVNSIGWVTARDLRITNTYRLSVHSPKSPSLSSISVYDLKKPTTVVATLHAGDVVVCGAPAGSGGKIVAHFEDKRTGRPLVGFVKKSQVRLTAVR